MDKYWGWWVQRSTVFFLGSRPPTLKVVCWGCARGGWDGGGGGGGVGELLAGGGVGVWGGGGVSVWGW